MVATTFVDPLDVACHTVGMNVVRPQQQPEKPQQEVRFSALDPVLDESLVMLERLGEHQAAIARENKNKSDSEKLIYEEYLQKKLYVFAMKRISIDLSDSFDGVSQNLSHFNQLNVAVERASGRGQKQFWLEPWVKELKRGGPDGQLMGVGLRVKLDDTTAKSLFVPPFAGPDHYRSKPTEDQLLKIESAKRLQAEMLEAGYLPVRYEIGSVVDDPSEALERLRGVVELGAWVSELTIVPSYPRSARLNDRFHGSQITRTYERVDERFAENLLPPVSPIKLSPNGEIPDDRNTFRDVS